MQTQQSLLATMQLISPRDVELVYTADQPIDALTDPVDDPCDVKCKGGGCNKALTIPEEADGILIF